MEIESAYGVKEKKKIAERSSMIRHEPWPLDQIDPTVPKFSCSLVWTPLPVVSWLAPFVGHVGVCKEDGTILDFSGSNFINVSDFAFDAPARYLQLDRDQCCFPPNLAAHSCKYKYKHAEYGSPISWDDALQSSVSSFENKSYNIFTCNSHSFVASCLNRLCYNGSMDWNIVNVAALVFLKGRWVNWYSVFKAFLPFLVVGCFGFVVVGWPFFVGLLSFSLMLLGWFLVVNYCFTSVMDD